MGLREKLAMMELYISEIAEEIEVRPGMPREENEVVIKIQESDLPDKGVVKQEFPVKDVSVVYQAL